MNNVVELAAKFEKVLLYFKTVSLCDFIEKYGDVLKSSDEMSFRDEFSSLLSAYRSSILGSTVNEPFEESFKEFSRKSSFLEDFIDDFEAIKALSTRIHKHSYYLDLTTERQKRIAAKLVSAANDIFLFDRNLTDSFNYSVLSKTLDAIKGIFSSIESYIPKFMGNSLVLYIFS